LFFAHLFVSLQGEKYNDMKERADELFEKSGVAGCALLHTKDGGRMPSEFLGGYHVHVIVRRGTMSFSDGQRMFHSVADDLVIWQMSNPIQRVSYSDDFEADFLIVSGDFLSRFNPEMVWASKGFIFIRINPSFRLHSSSLRLIDADFSLFRSRLEQPASPFKEEVVGRVMQIFLYDLWTVYASELSQMAANDNAARIFLRFLSLVQKDCRRQRDVAYYADLLFITSKYLSQVSRTVSGLPASQWISFYTTFELVSLLNDQSKTLNEVAWQMNFETASHFSRYVKKLLGVSPSEYRSQHSSH